MAYDEHAREFARKLLRFCENNDEVLKRLAHCEAVEQTGRRIVEEHGELLERLAEGPQESTGEK